jgi:hypothetical protein
MKYPAVVEDILEDLEKTRFVGDLKYNTIIQLSVIFKTQVSPYNFFTE